MKIIRCIVALTLVGLSAACYDRAYVIHSYRMIFVAFVLANCAVFNLADCYKDFR